MTLYRGPGGTGSATSDADTTLYQDFLNQTIAARDAALQAEINAELAETNAETAETNAETAETNAETAATNAASSASAAASSASSASTSASNASTSASAASTSATNAASSASSASSSASAASTSASNAATSATNAANSASSASTSATNAANSASTATTQATNAASSATAAASSASSASTSATNAANSASAASTSATNAANSATSAAASATAAAASAASIDASTLVRLTGDQTIGGTKTFSSNPIISAGTVNGVAYLNGSKVLTSGNSLVFDGTNLGVGTSSTLGNSTVNAVLGFAARNSGATPGYFQTYNSNAGSDLKTWRMGGDSSGNLVFETVNDAYSSSTNRMTLSSAGNLTLPAGTANGVAYLNGSKVMTSGSALTFDGSRLSVAGTSPSIRIDDIDTSGAFGIDWYYSGAGGVTRANITLNSTGEMQFQAGASGSPGWYQTFVLSGSEQMRLTSTGLGIGTSSPSDKLHVASAASTYIRTQNTGASIDAYYGVSGTGAWTGTGTNHPYLFYTNNAERMRLDSSGNLGLGVTPSAWRTSIADRALDIGSTTALYNQFGGSTILLNNAYRSEGNTIRYKVNGAAQGYWQDGGIHYWTTAPSGTAGNAISFTQAMTLDASGNLGVGTTSPSGRIHAKVAGAYGVVIIDNSSTTGGGGFAAQQNGSTRAVFGVSGYIEGNTSSDAALFAETGGAIRFYTNGSGTERARITSGGTILLGGTTILNGFGAENVTEFAYVTGNGFCAINSSNANAPLYISRSSSAATGTLINFATSGTSVGSIGTNGATTSYNTSSDYRLKTLVGEVTGSGDRIDALNPVEFDWNVNGQRDRGFFAHQFQAVYPNSVTGSKDAVDANGNPVYQSMQAGSSEVIADLVAEIKSLRARVAALESN